MADKSIDTGKNEEQKVSVKKNYRIRRSIDIPFLTVVIILLCAGIVMVATASYVYAGHRYGDNLFFIKRHLIYVALGLLGMFLMSKIPYTLIRKLSGVIFCATLVMMALVLLMGADANGARRWIYIGPISIQPSEIMKLSVILVCADYIDRMGKQITLRGQPGSFFGAVVPVMSAGALGAIFVAVPLVVPMLVEKLAGSAEMLLSDGSENPYYPIVSLVSKTALLFYVLGAVLLVLFLYLWVRKNIVREAPDFVFGILPFGILIVVLAVLLVLQPHMSGLIIITSLILIMMIVGGSNARYLLGLAGVGGVGLASILFLLPHSRGRLEVWKDPFSHLRQGGWQPAQSLYAIGNGGLWGVGIGQSRQKHMYLPEPMNDYIFAILCEEFGFIGAMAVIILFVYFVYRGILIAFRAPDKFSSLVVLGITAQVGLQALLNMMVVTNTLPSTGISLPFFSYGGTSLIILMCEIGIVLSISKYSIIEKK